MKVYCILEESKLLAVHATEATALQSISLSHCNIQGVRIAKERLVGGNGWLVCIEQPEKKAVFLVVEAQEVLEETTHL